MSTEPLRTSEDAERDPALLPEKQSALPPARLGRALGSALRIAWDRIGLVMALSLTWALLLCLPLAIGRLMPVTLTPPSRDALTALVAALLLSAPAAGIFRVAHLLCS